MALIDKASLLMVPSVYEDGTLYNVLPSGNKAPDETGNHNGYDQTRADFTFSRGSNLAATRVNSDGLIEKGRENLLLQSNAFDTTWATQNASVTSGQSGYDGTNDAWLFSHSSSTGYLYQQKSLSASINTASIYVKGGTSSTIRLDFVTGSFVKGASCSFDLSNGTAGSITHYGSSSGFLAAISSVGNDWYRISLTGLTTAETWYHELAITSGNIYIQNAQLEKGLVATDVITTTTASVQAGILEDMPRINYDANGENGALLLEPSRTNSFPYSEPFNGSGQTASVGSYLSGDSFGIGVYGGVQLNAGSTHYYYGFSSAASTQYAVSFFVRRTDGGVPRLGTGSGDANGDFCFVASGDVYSPNDWDTTPTITLFKDDIYKFEGVLTTPAVVDNFGPLKYSNNSAINVQITGLQAEPSASYPSSYVPTYGSAVTRSADSCSVTGVSDVIGQSEGTLFVEFEYSNNSVGVVSIHSGNIGNRVYIGTDSNGLISQVRVGYTQQAFFSTSLTIGTTYKCALAYKANDFVLYVNGSQIGTDTSGTVPSSMIKLGFESGAGGDVLNQPTKQTMLFKERLSNSELADLTS